MSRTLNCAASPSSQNGKTNCNEVFQYSNAIFFSPTFVLRDENRGVCGGSDLESRTELRNGLDFEIHSFESFPDNGH